jgi:hypothetical protein
MAILNNKPFINTGLFDDINKTNNQINSMNIPQAPQVPQVDPMVRRQRAGNMMLALSDVLRGQDPSQGVLQRQQMIAQQQQKAEQDKLNQELNAAIDSSNIPESQKTFIKAMGVQQKYDALYGQKAGQRKIIKAADGYNYYADTGERVLPGVKKEPSIESQTTDYKNYLNSLEEGEIPTGAGFLAYQDRNIKKDKMSYGMKQDVNSYWRYTEGPMKGQRVFPDVTKEKEEEEKEPYNIGDEDKLRDDYRSESKEFVNVRNAFGRILSVEPTAAGDLSLIFNYMKMLDPGSVVRESEYENAAQSGAFGERVKAAYLRYKSGERLTESMREDFKTQANNLYQTQSDNQSYVMEEFKNLAEEYGMKPSRIVQNYGSPIEDKLLEIKLKSLPLNELATLDLSQYSEKQLDIIKKVIKSKGKQ